MRSNLITKREAAELLGDVSISFVNSLLSRGSFRRERRELTKEMLTSPSSSAASRLVIKFDLMRARLRAIVHSQKMRYTLGKLPPWSFSRCVGRALFNP